MLRWKHFQNLNCDCTNIITCLQKKNTHVIFGAQHQYDVIYSPLDDVYFELARYLHQVETVTSSAHLACHEILS